MVPFSAGGLAKPLVFLSRKIPILAKVALNLFVTDFDLELRRSAGGYSCKPERRECSLLADERSDSTKAPERFWKSRVDKADLPHC